MIEPMKHKCDLCHKTFSWSKLEMLFFGEESSYFVMCKKCQKDEQVKTCYEQAQVLLRMLNRLYDEISKKCGKDKGV